MADEHRSINVYTVQIAQWRKVAARELKMFDTTVRSGSRFVCPSWEMVLGHKAGTVSDEEYTAQYKEIMDKSIRDHSEWWDEFVRQENIVLACYCKSGKFCHRYILRDIIKELCEQKDLVFVDKGEIE